MSVRKLVKNNRAFLLTIILVALGSFSVIGIFAYNQLYEQRRSLASELHTSVSAQTGAAMSLWLDDQVMLAQTLAKAPDIIEFCKEPANPAKRADALAYLEGIHRDQFTLINIMYYFDNPDDYLLVEVDGKKVKVGNGCSILDSIGGRSIGVGGLNFSYIKAVAEG